MKTSYQPILNIIAGMIIMALLGLIASTYGDTNTVKPVHPELIITNQDMQNILNSEAYFNANPEDSETYKKIGYLNFINGNYREAILKFEKAYSLRIDDAYLLHLISETYFAMNQPEDGKLFQKKAQEVLYIGIAELLPSKTQELKYSIQLGVFKNEPSKDFFQDLDQKQIKKEMHHSGYTIYTYGNYNNHIEATRNKNELIKRGYSGIYITLNYAKVIAIQDKTELVEKIR